MKTDKKTQDIIDDFEVWVGKMEDKHQTVSANIYTDIMRYLNRMDRMIKRTIKKICGDPINMVIPDKYKTPDFINKGCKNKKKRYYKELEVFSIGRGSYQVHVADGNYWRKEAVGPNGYGSCMSCCFRMAKGKGACAMLACHACEREDKQEVVFERI